MLDNLDVQCTPEHAGRCRRGYGAARRHNADGRQCARCYRRRPLADRDARLAARHRGGHLAGHRGGVGAEQDLEEPERERERREAEADSLVVFSLT